MRVTSTRFLVLWLSLMSWGVIGQAQITTYPYLETFDGFSTCSPSAFGTCNLSAGWTNLTTDDADWIVYNRSTGSFATGPNNDFTTCATNTCPASGVGNGNYLYTETSGGVAGRTYIMESPQFDITGMTNPVFAFYYHMAGSTMGSLFVEINDGTTITTLWTRTGAQHPGETSPWTQASVPLTGHGNLVSIRFRGVRGTSFSGDIGIDQVRVLDASTPDIGVAAITKPIDGRGCAYTANEAAEVELTNAGFIAIDFAVTPATVTLTATGASSASFTQTVNTGTLAPGATLAVAMGTLDMTNPGVTTFDATVAMTGDGGSGNNTAQHTVERAPIISSYPYFQDFESGAQGWSSNGANNNWELATPANTVINSAASGSNSWVTNATGLYANNSQSYVESPCLDLTSLTAPLIKMQVWWENEFSWDGGQLQGSTDGGATWFRIGDLNDPNNWYNDASITGLNWTGSGVGWTGRLGSGSGTWVEVEHDLTGMAGQSDARLRMAFGSDGSVQSEGIAFDDVLIYDLPQHDAAINQVISSSVCAGMRDIEVEIASFGQSPLSTVRVITTVNGTLVGPAVGTKIIFNPPLTRGQSQIVTVGQFNFVNGVSYTIDATINIPNGQPDGFNLNDNGTFTGAPAMNGTFTINPNGGDFPDFAVAVAELTAKGVCGPVVFNVAGGTYTENMVIGSIGGTSAANTVTFQADPANTSAVNLERDGGISGNYIVRFDGASYIIFDGMNMTNTNTTPDGSGRVIEFIGMNDHVSLTNNVMSASNAVGNFVNDTESIIYDNRGVGNMSNNIIIDGNTLNGGDWGIYMYGNSTTQREDGNQITNNTIQNFLRYGIYTWFQDNIITSGNTVLHDPASVSSLNYGIYRYFCDHGEVEGNKVVIYGFNSTQYGIYLWENRAPNGVLNVSNNMVSIIGGTSTQFGIYPYNAENMNVYHNSVQLTAGSNFGRAFFFNSTSSTFGTNATIGNVRVLNNIGSNLGTGKCVEIGWAADRRGYVTTMNFNDWYTGGKGVVGRYVFSDYLTLADWQAASGQDATSKSEDPEFEGPTDLHCNAVSLDNSAINIGVMVDIDDQERCNGLNIGTCVGNGFAPDIGADEFFVPPFDISARDLLLPFAGLSCTYSSTEQIRVQVKSSGRFALDFAATALTVTVNVTGPIPGSYSKTINTGSLASGATLDVDMGIIDMTTPGMYDFTITTAMSNDGKATNNTSGPHTIQVDAGLATPYVQTFDSWDVCPNFGTPGNTQCQTPDGWTQSSDDDFNWSIRSLRTGSFATGPSGDYNGGGNYLYTETSGNNNTVGIIESPCFDINGLACPFAVFYYHMYGSQMGTLVCEVNDGTGWTAVTTLVGQQHISEDDDWTAAAIDLTPFRKYLKVRFVGMTGFSFRSDMAIDNFVITDAGGGFIATPAVGNLCEPFNFFADNSIPAINSFYQVDPAVDAAGNPTHQFIRGTAFDLDVDIQFLKAGTYTVSRGVNGLCGRQQFSTTVVVNKGVSDVKFDVNSTEGVANCTVFEFTDETILSTYAWAWGFRNPAGKVLRAGVDFAFMNGTVRNDQNVSVMFTHPGIYTVEFYANSGCDSSKVSVTRQITVAAQDPGPAATGDILTAPGIANLSATPMPGGTLTWYDQQFLGNVLATGATYSPFVSKTRSFWVGNMPPPPVTQTLTTTFADNNGQDGNMFNVENIGSRNLTIDEFTANISNTGAAEMEIWTTPTTYLGNETNAAVWTLIGTVSVVSNGPGNPTVLPIGGIDLPVGSSMGVYVTGINGTSVGYTNGTNGSNQVSFDDGDLKIITGVGKSYPFGSTFSIRMWNGSISYSAGACPTARTEVVATVDLGSSAKNGIDVNGTASSLTVYPNPFTSNLTATFTVDQDLPVTATLYDMLGKIVFRSEIRDVTAGVNTKELTLDNKLAAGVYTLSISQNGKEQKAKVIKE